jgi:tetratricopeptide (TPR) repeat protein
MYSADSSVNVDRVVKDVIA